MSVSRIAGVIKLTANGTSYNLAGDFTYDIGGFKREMMAGPDGVHGYKETVKIPFIEGDLRDTSDVDLVVLTEMTDVTLVLTLANSKTISLFNATFTGDGTVSTGEATIKARWEGLSATEV